MKSIIIKVKCGDDIRKFKYPKRRANIAGLRSILRRLYKFAASDPLWIKYKDRDDDWITLDSEDDLRIAIELGEGESLNIEVTPCLKCCCCRILPTVACSHVLFWINLAVLVLDCALKVWKIIDPASVVLVWLEWFVFAVSVILQFVALMMKRCGASDEEVSAQDDDKKGGDDPGGHEGDEEHVEAPVPAAEIQPEDAEGGETDADDKGGDSAATAIEEEPNQPVEVMASKRTSFFQTTVLCDKECLGFPGCTTRVRDLITGQASEFSHEQYLKLVMKFHTRLTVVLSSIIASDSSKFTLVRNTFIVMSKIVQHFPFHTPNYEAIEKELMSRVGKMCLNRPILMLKMKCQETFVQYQKFALYNVKPEEYAKRVPSLEILLRYFHVEIQSAMCLNRPILMLKMKEVYRSSLQSLESTDESDPELQHEKKVALFKGAFDHVMEDLQRELVSIYPSEHWDDMTSRVYATFWFLSAADLQVPLKAYEKHIKAHGGEVGSVKKEAEVESDSRRHAKVEVSDVARKLRSEMRAQIEHVDLVRDALAAQRSLFPETQSRMVRFLQRCLLPRSILSEADAVYCVKFIELLHQNRTPFFQTIVLYDKVFSDIEPMLASMTETEVQCYGTFVCKSLEMLMRWRSQTDFDAECLGFPGCTTRVRDPITGQASEFSHEQYLKLVMKFHTRLTVVLSSILASDSSKFTLLRNTLIVMSKIVQHFPFHTPNYEAIEKRVKELMSRVGKTMPDLSLLTKSYSGKLRLRLAEVKKREQRMG